MSDIKEENFERLVLGDKNPGITGDKIGRKVYGLGDISPAEVDAAVIVSVRFVNQIDKELRKIGIKRV